MVSIDEAAGISDDDIKAALSTTQITLQQTTARRDESESALNFLPATWTEKGNQTDVMDERPLNDGQIVLTTETRSGKQIRADNARRDAKKARQSADMAARLIQSTKGLN